MIQHYRHYRVVNRAKQDSSPSCSDTICKVVHQEPLLAFGIFLALFLLLIKCLCCHK